MRRMPIREAPTAHRFKVAIYDFSCEDLQVGDERCEPYLRIDFDNFKIFQTDVDMDSCNPEWGFKAGFQYEMHYLERLRDRRLKISVLNRANGLPVGDASIDLQTVACGPASFRLTLFDRKAPDKARGMVRFSLVMKMMSRITIIFRELSLTMQGCPAPARMQLSCSLQDEGDDCLKDCDRHFPFSPDGTWAGPFSITLVSSLNDILKAPDFETLKFVAIDENGMRQGEALLPFRSAFSVQPDATCLFKAAVTYSVIVEGDQDKADSLGTVGTLEGHVLYQNLPVYAQMAGGVCVDGEVQGASWLFDGLPYPKTMVEPPPLWDEEKDRLDTFLNAISHDLDLGPDEEYDLHNIDLDNIDDEKIAEALDHIDLPPPWEKRRERNIDGEKNRVYFTDPRARRSTWKDPRFLPENWDQRIDAQSGKVYFQYHKTKQTTTIDPRCCSPGWDMRLSKDGEIYFAYMPAMKTTFADPRGLPEGIDAALDDLGRLYFKNHHERSTSWDDPRNEQQEVTLAAWRHSQHARWWKEQVWREMEERRQEHLEEQDEEGDESDDADHGDANHKAGHDASGKN
eukprot:TRINITY_DN32813_c0_g1_i1.p1 TRINITY_DN32813_c0_g1~~TRINITY_DN32813_c0_g1_i1.p1  ORF type:complete len:570 (-),score=104.80 TRINITY_DN32813_c0_g1_i1:265-1974(-)